MGRLHFHHLGIVVPTIKSTVSKMNDIFDLNLATVKCEYEPEYDVDIELYSDSSGLVNYEFLCPRSELSPLWASLQKKRNLIHHLAYGSSRFEDSMTLLRKKGYFPLGDPVSAKLFGGNRVVFFMSPEGLVFELVEVE